MPDLNIDSPPLGQQQDWMRSRIPSAPPPWQTERVTPGGSEPPEWAAKQWRAEPEPPPETETLVQDEPSAVEPDEDDAVDAQSEPPHESPSADAHADSRPSHAFRQVKRENLADYIGEVARRILGSENRDLSSGDELRFGTHGSIAVMIDGDRKGTWFDHENHIGGGVSLLIEIKGNVARADVFGWLRDELGFEIEGTKPRRRLVTSYIYHDEAGNPLARKNRWEPKFFSWERAEGAGGWTGGKGCMNGVRRVLYRLPEVKGAPAEAAIFIVEGEKDADNAAALGLVATCNPDGGSKTKNSNPGKWRPEFSESLRGRHVVAVIPDNDDVGRSHARTVAARVAAMGSEVRIVDLPGLPEKGDLSDWIAAGGTREQLEALVAAAPVFEPQRDVPRDETKPGEKIIISTNNPFWNSNEFLARNYTIGEHHTLRRHRSSFYQWIDGAYRLNTDAGIRTKLYNYLAKCWELGEGGAKEPVWPDSKMVSDHADALRAAAHLDDDVEAPSWLGEEPANMPADEMLSLQNGLLHLPSKSLIDHSPAFFTYNVLPFDYDPNPPEPKQWLTFLRQLWPDDKPSIATLQEFFGLCLTDITAFQKALMVLGPKRCGKGTIARILRALIGQLNVSGPTLSQLATEFGLAPLIGKRVAIISDARIGPKTDIMALAERLLTITGEDAVDVNRKNLPHWHGQLRVRFVIISNETPRFADASGALAGRFIVLRIVPSFYGKEDLGLTEKLMPELPGILLWAMAGLDRLLDRGHFEQPDSAKDDVSTMEDIGSPVAAFVRERCEVGAGFTATVDDVYESWVGWCEKQRRQPGAKEVFGRDLKTVLPTLKVTRPRDKNGERFRQYEGIKIRPISTGSRTNFNDAPEQPRWTR